MNLAQNSKQIKTIIQAINIWILLENHVLFTYLYDIPYTIFSQHTTKINPLIIGKALIRLFHLVQYKTITLFLALSYTVETKSNK